MISGTSLWYYRVQSFLVPVSEMHNYSTRYFSGDDLYRPIVRTNYGYLNLNFLPLKFGMKSQK